MCVANLREKSRICFARYREDHGQICSVMVPVTSGGLVSSSPTMEIAISRKVIAITGRLPERMVEWTIRFNH